MAHFLAIDVGTGSTRAALVDGSGRILRIAAQEQQQIVPQYGWSEQRPADWWQGVAASVRQIAGFARDEALEIAAVCACGQMHGTVLVDGAGGLVRDAVPLWNDKRTVGHVQAFERAHPVARALEATANPPTPAWPGFKLQWLRDNDPGAFGRAALVLMPKDYINLRLTGVAAMDRTEAASSFMMDPQTGDWSDRMLDLLGLSRDLLPPILQPEAVLGTVTAAAAAETGLARGIPVLVGGGDYPLALLGSGVVRPGMVSEVAGTSSIITLVADGPILDPEICNVGMPGGAWGGFVLLEAGGDAARWARRVFHDNAAGYGEVLDLAAGVPAGAEGLFFLPYLTGERLGAHRNSRAQVFGLAAGHGLGHLHRAVLEGVGFAVNRHLEVMRAATGTTPEVLIASGGGAKADLWLRIKASIYGLPIRIPAEAECSVIGCAMLAAVATGHSASLSAAVDRFVRYEREIAPDPAWAGQYARMQPVFNRLCAASRAFYDDLDALAQPATRG